jgi:hypothetical protein
MKFELKIIYNPAHVISHKMILYKTLPNKIPLTKILIRKSVLEFSVVIFRSYNLIPTTKNSVTKFLQQILIPQILIPVITFPYYY